MRLNHIEAVSIGAGSLFIILGIVTISISSVLTLEVKSEPCFPSNCDVIAETCTWKSVSYPCYSAKGNYTFVYQGQEYFYDLNLISGQVIEIAHASCQDFMASPAETCYFKLPDIEQTVDIYTDQYFRMGILIFITAILLICGFMAVVMGVKSYKFRTRDQALLV